MAKNRKYAKGNSFPIPVAEGVTSGKAVALGSLPGVALIDRDANGEATCQFDGVWKLAVKGVGPVGNLAVAAGDILYLQSNGDINVKNDTGVRYGYALGAVGSGLTATIDVKLGY